MQSKSVPFLDGTLVLTILGFMSLPLWASPLEHQNNLKSPNTLVSSPLPGKNSIDALKVSQNEKGQWVVHLEYFYTGAPELVFVRLDLLADQDQAAAAFLLPQPTWMQQAAKGRHRINHVLTHPGLNRAFTSSGVMAQFVQILPPPQNSAELASMSVNIKIDWPDARTHSVLEELRTTELVDYLTKTARLIDDGGKERFAQARHRLDFLLHEHPQFHSAYLELARIAMKTNWGPEGLRQAATYIDTARKLAPEDPNVWILQAYVYTHQGRYKEAEPLFIAASNTATPNLWLWSNWGEFYNIQGKGPQALQMFLKAIDAPPPGNTYDRARIHAYEQALAILKKQNRLDQIETLLQKRYADYASACNGAELSQFMLMKRGNLSRAVELANQQALAACSSPNPRDILGLSYYVMWAQASADEQPRLLNRARVLFPSGTKLIYQLAGSNHTFKALTALKAEGELIDQMDNQKMTALAYALSDKDHDAAQRLLQLQARADLAIGASELPLALIPVIVEDYSGIKLLRQYGVDYAKIKFKEMTAFDHAKRLDNRKLLEALGGKPQI